MFTLIEKIMENLIIPQQLSQAGLLRRLAAICYDALLLSSVLVFATALFLALTVLIIFLFTKQFLMVHLVESNLFPIFQIYLFGVSFLYFAWFWLHGGQTVGMKAWSIQLQSIEGKKITWGQAFKRFMTAIVSWFVLGLGFFWVLWEKEGRSWHDLASQTQLVHVRKSL